VAALRLQRVDRLIQNCDNPCGALRGGGRAILFC